MSFSERLAQLVRRYHHASDDLKPAGCDCSSGWGALGAWVFTCRPCFEAGMSQLMRECDDGAPLELELEVNVVVEPPAPPKGWA